MSVEYGRVCNVDRHDLCRSSDRVVWAAVAARLLSLDVGKQYDLYGGAVQESPVSQAKL